MSLVVSAFGSGMSSNGAAGRRLRRTDAEKRVENFGSSDDAKAKLCIFACRRLFVSEKVRAIIQKRRNMNFSKTFLAGLLAFIVGNVLIVMLWSLFVMGIVGALSATAGLEKGSILRIDLSENIVEAPPANPFAGIDFRTMTSTPHVTLFDALRAIDAAKSDPRIEGIYIRPNGQGAVSMAVLGGAARRIARFQGRERQIRAGLRRDVRTGRLLPGLGGRRSVCPARRRRRLARAGVQYLILQGIVG